VEPEQVAREEGAAAHRHCAFGAFERAGQVAFADEHPTPEEPGFSEQPLVGERALPTAGIGEPEDGVEGAQRGALEALSLRNVGPAHAQRREVGGAGMA
jgi:hypothetical protein